MLKIMVETREVAFSCLVKDFFLSVFCEEMQTLDELVLRLVTEMNKETKGKLFDSNLKNNNNKHV